MRDDVSVELLLILAAGVLDPAGELLAAPLLFFLFGFPGEDGEVDVDVAVFEGFVDHFGGFGWEGEFWMGLGYDCDADLLLRRKRLSGGALRVGW